MKVVHKFPHWYFKGFKQPHVFKKPVWYLKKKQNHHPLKIRYKNNCQITPWKPAFLIVFSQVHLIQLYLQLFAFPYGCGYIAKHKLLVLHYTFPDVLFFLSGIWIPQILQTPQEHPHIKEDTQGSSVFWEKFTYKLLQGAPMIKISSQEKGEQMKE